MNVLRSINIADDRTREDVIAAYRPTRKTLQVVRAVCGLERSTATHVVAPYGAGKSLAALAGITLIAGEPSTARDLRARIVLVDPDLAAAAAEASGPTLVLLLHGACPDLAAVLSERAGVKSGPLDKVLTEILRKARQGSIARIAIVWDEFGQHLETLVREGRPEDLLAVQDLAEWAVRRSEPRVTLTTLMHQGVYHYTRRASETTQSAWKKIEGRFDTLSLIDDGVDALEMLAEALNGCRSAPDAAAIGRARAAGFFSDVTDDARLAEILVRTAPLTPAALQVLPSLAAQVAQAERTMFRFLADVAAADEPSTSLGVDALYDFFAPAMRSDTGPGGTHRRFVEAETALSRTETDLERQVVKTAALLQLGRSAERLKLPRSRLVYAVAEGTDTPPDDIEVVIEALVARKLLLHRRRLDDISIWHGADIDLGQMVAEEAARLAMDSDPVAALEQMFAPDSYTAPPYNHARGITRFAQARFVRASDLTSASGLEALRKQADAEDALVALVIDATADRPDLVELARALPPHLILALPRRSAEVGSILAELLALEVLLDRRELLATDPLVERELKELKAEAEAALRQSLERLMNPDRGEVVWLSGPTLHSFAEGGTLGEILSRLFETRFPQTPKIANEQVVRRKVSAVTRSARKRCMLAIIERTGIRALGYGGATSADASLYRTVLERTGLYASSDGAWRWRVPSELGDLSMQHVWREIERFFVDPSDQPKSVEDLIDRLTAPPIGLREGVLPLLLTAGMVAFGRALALREVVDGRARYVDDVQPSLIEKMCEEPKRFELEVPALTRSQSRNLEKMIRCLVGDLDPQEPDLLRGFYDALLEWRGGLPPTALSTRGLGENADLLQPLLRKKAFDPVDFLFRELPRVLGEPALNAATIEGVATAVRQIESVSSAFADRAVDVAAAIFCRRLRGSPRSLLDAASKWAACVPLADEAVRALDHEARGVLARARTAVNVPRGERGFVTQLSGILCGEGFEAWDDRTADIFRDRLEKAVVRIEDAVLEHADGSDAFEPFLRNKLATIFDVYGAKIGNARLIKYLDEIYKGAS
ncbi:hypothetical protein [Falsirhodobacter algicola]|uniref:ATP-binding protein n=1 Tax=Falsirhodobacter algicola TaxID=2692330 RepID=A0A8J8SM36_9RHOB|nr:hypothetical protein [Falsirhodobacter algicola]QUS37107.1 hypothetical protein GR316_12070 [Falsirhodobacter algicola]